MAALINDRYLRTAVVRILFARQQSHRSRPVQLGTNRQISSQRVQQLVVNHTPVQSTTEPLRGGARVRPGEGGGANFGLVFPKTKEHSGSAR